MSDSTVCELLVRGSVGLAIAGYLGRYMIETAGPATASRDRRARAAWTIGCGLYLMHVIVVFHCIHNWSHANAYAHTAEEMAQKIGYGFGGGLYFNYVFTVLWTMDVIAWWRRPGRGLHARFAWQRATEAFLAFIVFNATVVFGPRYWWWIAAAVATAFLLLSRPVHRLLKRLSG